MLGFLLSPILSASSFPGSSEYYAHFRYAGARFLPYLDRSWLRLTAQGIAESNLDANARSPAGAIGVMQFMPATWAECTQALNLSKYTPPTYAKANIICGGWYMNRRMRVWSGRDRDPIDQWPLALSDYNGGGKITLRAQRNCNDALLWKDTEPCHPYRETRTYVFRVQRIFDGLSQ